ncbi:MAG TPA: hypothetical protein VFX28_00120, partial [Methylomirabilota bacterium]|nr:hypothetical protein [Methylomirabilota bacterium]
MGPLLLMLALPPLTYYFWICLRDFGGSLVLPGSPAELQALAARVPPPTPRAVALYGGWVLLQVLLQWWAPG